MPNVKIKNYVGDDCIYEDVDKVWIASEDSTDDNPDLLPYTYGEALDGVEVAPDFSAGDMAVTMPEGYLARSAVVKKPENLIPGNIKAGETVAGIPGEYEGEAVELEEVTVALAMADGDQVIEPTEGKALGKVTITKPETLVPENIAEGVDIGGVIGALVAGGVGNIVYDSGTVTGKTDETVVINHNLGVTPDLIIVYTDGYSTSGSFYVKDFIGISSALAEATGNVFGNMSTQVKYMTNSGGYQCFRYTAYSNTTESGHIDTTSIAFTSFVHSANENSFSLKNGSGSVYFLSTLTYKWFAIGGLT